MNDWDVSAIDDMSNLFKDKTTFNEDISGWNVSNVTNISSLFMKYLLLINHIGMIGMYLDRYECLQNNQVF